MPPAAVPSYFVYGEPSRTLDLGFLHVETVRQRNSIHLGEVAPHTHAQMGQITIWTSGGGTYRIEDRSWNFTAPAAVFVPSGVVHGFSLTPEGDAIVVSVADMLLDRLAARSGLSVGGPVFADEPTGGASAWSRLAQIAELAMAEYREGSLRGQQATHPVLDALITALLAAVLQLAGGSLESETPARRLAQRLREAVNAHFREDWPVARYVDLLGSTPHLLDRTAREVLAMPVKEVVLRRRLLEAKRLLLFTIRSVEDVAFELGFRDPAYFARFFRLRTGESPSGWRQRETAAMARRDP